MQAVVKEKGWNGRIRDCDRRRYIFEKSDNSRAVKEYGQQGRAARWWKGHCTFTCTRIAPPIQHVCHKGYASNGVKNNSPEIINLIWRRRFSQLYFSFPILFHCTHVAGAFVLCDFKARKRTLWITQAAGVALTLNPWKCFSNHFLVFSGYMQ